MKKTDVLFLLLCSFLGACGEAKKDRVSEISFRDPDTLKYSDIITIERVIPLETTRESLIGVIDKIQLFEDRIFILDIFTLKKVLVFDRNGAFLGQIGHSGRGPGEYLEPV